MESSAELRSAILTHAKSETRAAQLCFGMAIVRFVNSVLDNYQRGQYALSLNLLAKQINLPAKFVELRHAATHESMPAMRVLRQGCRDALEWWHEQYWLPNIALLDTPAHQLIKLITKKRASNVHFTKLLSVNASDQLVAQLLQKPKTESVEMGLITSYIKEDARFKLLFRRGILRALQDSGLKVSEFHRLCGLFQHVKDPECLEYDLSFLDVHTRERLLSSLNSTFIIAS